MVFQKSYFLKSKVRTTALFYLLNFNFIVNFVFFDITPPPPEKSNERSKPSVIKFKIDPNLKAASLMLLFLIYLIYQVLNLTGFCNEI